VYTGIFGGKIDPGPCPVDDAPHTTCVAPPGGSVVSPITTTIRAPRSMAATLETLRRRALEAQGVVVPPPERHAPTFTTKTYSRGKHARRSRA